MTKISVVGTTSWGTTLAIIQARKGASVRLWARTREAANELNAAGENSAILPGIRFPENLLVTNSFNEALDGAAVVVYAVPSQSLRVNVGLTAGRVDPHSLVVTAAKGLELETSLRMSQVIADVLDIPASTVCVLSGPNLASEIARGLPAASVAACPRLNLAEKASHLLSAPGFCVIPTDDAVGVELGGALKNIIALGAGVADGLGLGDNAKAILVTQGWSEITALGIAMGARASTFSGLAGLGDLVATCASPLSRNHFYGEQIAKGRTLDEVARSTPHVAEGVPTTRVAYHLARELRVEMPIIELMYHLLFEGATPEKTVRDLMAITARIAGKVG